MKSSSRWDSFSVALGGTFRWGRNVSTSLLALLRRFPGRECLIPRDRIYSLLSLYSRGNEFPVDYSQPDDDLLCQVLDYSAVKIGMCSIVNIVNTLKPFHESSSDRFIELNPKYMAIEWEPLRNDPNILLV